jgi:hypothetical protein
MALIARLLSTIVSVFFYSTVTDPGAIDEQPHWYWLQDNSGGLASLPLVPSQGHPNNQPGVNGKGPGTNQNVPKFDTQQVL